MPPVITLQLELTADEAADLAQFLKRAYWNTWRDLAKSDGQAYSMRDACEKVQRALAEAGFAPR